VVALISGTDLTTCRDAAEEARRQAARKAKSAKAKKKKSTVKKTAPQGGSSDAAESDAALLVNVALAMGGDGAAAMEMDESEAPDTRFEQSVRQQQNPPSYACAVVLTGCLLSVDVAAGPTLRMRPGVVLQSALAARGPRRRTTRRSRRNRGRKRKGSPLPRSASLRLSPRVHSGQSIRPQHRVLRCVSDLA
jgi:hypothetical protein